MLFNKGKNNLSHYSKIYSKIITQAWLFSNKRNIQKALPSQSKDLREKEKLVKIEARIYEMDQKQ